MTFTFHNDTPLALGEVNITCQDTTTYKVNVTGQGDFPVTVSAAGQSLIIAGQMVMNGQTRIINIGPGMTCSILMEDFDAWARGIGS